MALLDMKPSCNATQRYVRGNSKFLPQPTSCIRVRIKSPYIEPVWDHVHLFFRVAESRMCPARSLRATNDTLREKARQPGACACGPDCGALVLIWIEIRVVNSPNHGSLLSQVGRAAADQISVVHPGLNHLRLRFFQ